MTDRPGQAAPQPTSEQAAKPAVLIIDDEEDVRLVARMSLSVAGFTVLEADGGRPGVELARERRPTAILLDIMMPQMDGIATLQALKADERTASIPVIFLTAKNLGADADRYRALGAVAIVNKPFQPRALAEQLKTLIG
jgi:CheY-like chemotaxis protein